MDATRSEIIEKYHETFYEDLHGWRDYELTSKGFGEWYYDCLPTDRGKRILDLGCGPGLYDELFASQGHHVTGVDISCLCHSGIYESE